jgi:DNA-binding MarR family transcriptional regulator
VHLAAWSSYSVSAHAWDILGIIWQGRAASTPDVINLVKKRCWTESETLEAINELVGKGWITNTEQLSLTEEGQQVRENAEELTDKFFFSPWRVLTDVEYKQLCELLTQLNETLAISKQTT